MSSGLLVLLIVGAVLFVAVGLQAMARQLQRFPVDGRLSPPLIDATRHTRWVVKPVEIEQLDAIVAESLSSEGVARSKLWPLLNELAADAPRPLTEEAATSTEKRRRDRDRRLDERLTQLERAYGIADDHTGDND